MPLLARIAAALFSLLQISLHALPPDANLNQTKPNAVIQEGPPPKTSYLVGSGVRDWIERGHREYYAGHPNEAIADYQRAIKSAPTALEAWVNGGAVWEERGNPTKAVEWLSKAAALSPRDPKILTDLGWANFHGRDWASAEIHFLAALAINPDESYALLGLGRVRMEQNRASEAIPLFTRAAGKKSAQTLALFWKGRALEATFDYSQAAEAYRRATSDDSYLLEARYSLGVTYLKSQRFFEAVSQFTRILTMDPENRLARQLMLRIQNALHLKNQEENRVWGRYDHKQEILLPQHGNIPKLRIGIGTTSMGRPLPRTGLDFESTTPFTIADSRTGRRLAAGDARELWHVHFMPRKAKSAPHVEILNSQGKRVAESRKPLVIRPDISRGGSLALYELPYTPGYHGNPTRERHLRGEIEISLHPNRRAFKIVNIVDLETYTNGVLAAEMPITSPLEALKAQSVVARTQALYVKNIGRVHRRDGYDLCDGEHCQVYAGVPAETERSRSVMAATRGRIVAYHGRAANVIYSSNCGGHTQKGSELHGWGRVPYWQAIVDMPPHSPAYPHSPWELRWWLRSEPPAYCMPSSFVYPSHYRWARVISAQELETRIRRTVRIGQILGVIALRRAASGHVNAIRILGSRRDFLIQDESRIRNLLAPGSQRSTLFFIETEYGAAHKPSAFVFHGAGWGHGVGMCQSGAAGRAEQGALYDDILKAYYPGVEIGNLHY